MTGWGGRRRQGGVALLVGLLLVPTLLTMIGTVSGASVAHADTPKPPATQQVPTAESEEGSDEDSGGGARTLTWLALAGAAALAAAAGAAVLLSGRPRQVPGARGDHEPRTVERGRSEALPDRERGRFARPPVVEPIRAEPVPVVEPIRAEPGPVVERGWDEPVPVVEPIRAEPGPVVERSWDEPIPVVIPSRAEPLPEVAPSRAEPVPVVERSRDDVSTSATAESPARPRRASSDYDPDLVGGSDDTDHEDDDEDEVPWSNWYLATTGRRARLPEPDFGPHRPTRASGASDEQPSSDHTAEPPRPRRAWRD